MLGAVCLDDRRGHAAQFRPAHPIGIRAPGGVLHCVARGLGAALRRDARQDGAVSLGVGLDRRRSCFGAAALDGGEQRAPGGIGSA
ncbi:MAG TPA: hypothetical protein VFS20_07970 [Longimicrobium sp.]|nr:hypothetical protein [Longimicrobium sp.]